MKKTYLLLTLSWLLTIKTSFSQEKATIENNSKNTQEKISIDENQDNENSLDDDYQETANLAQAETQILFELTKELKGNFYLDEETFKENDEFTPKHMINLYLKTHEISKQSYTYAEKYKRQCKLFSIKDLEKLEENDYFLSKETWSFDEINQINIKLNNLSREKYNKELDKKIKQQEKSKKKRERKKRKEERIKEKKFRKRNTLFFRKKDKKDKKGDKKDKEQEQGDKDKDKTKEDKKNKKNYIKNDFIIITDKASYKSMAKNDELDKNRIYLKVSEPIFTKNKKKAMIFVSQENQESLDNYLVVLRKKSKSWCIQGKIQSNKEPIDKIKPIKKEIDAYKN